MKEIAKKTKLYSKFLTYAAAKDKIFINGWNFSSCHE